MDTNDLAVGETRTSFWIDNFTLIRLLCGSVQTNAASISRTFDSP